jgi:exopolysaccharide production protein ExoZ
MTNASSANKIYGIQYLRGIAALGVVLFHAALKTKYSFAVGAAGVDIFFVISGFIMWTLAANRPLTPWQFLADRAARVVPFYWAATGLMLLGGIAGLFPNLVLDVEHTLKSLFFIPARSPSNGEVWPVLVQGWTLTYEVFFYLTFALALNLRPALRLPVMSALLLLLVGAGYVTAPVNPVAQTYTNPLLLEFLLGMMLAEVWRRCPRENIAGGGLMLALAVAGFVAIQLKLLPQSVPVTAPLATLAVAGVLLIERTISRYPSRLAAYLGDSSYSVYLWHAFAIGVVAKVGNKLALPDMLIFSSAVLGGVVAGAAAYELLEKPLLNFFRKQRALTRQTSAVAP